MATSANFLQQLNPKARDDLRRVLISELYGLVETFVGSNQGR